MIGVERWPLRERGILVRLEGCKGFESALEGLDMDDIDGFFDRKNLMSRPLTTLFDDLVEPEIVNLKILIEIFAITKTQRFFPLVRRWREKVVREEKENPRWRIYSGKVYYAVKPSRLGSRQIGRAHV